MSESDPPRRPPVVPPWGPRTGPVGVPGGRGPRASGPDRRQRVALLVMFAVLLLLIFAPAVTSRLSDWLWFREIGFQRVFVLKILAQWMMALPVALVSFALIYLTARAALARAELAPLEIVNELQFAAARVQSEMILRVLRGLALPTAGVFAFLMAIGAASQWRTVAQFLYRTPFGTTDPVFGRDIGYYVFTIPMLELVVGFLSAALALALLWGAVGAAIEIRMGQPGPWRRRIDSRRHMLLASLLAMLIVLTGFDDLILKPAALLLAPHTPLQGASYADLNVRLPMLRVVGVLAFVVAGVLLWGAWQRRLWRTAVVAVGGFILARILLIGVVPALYQRLVVQANELARESPQIRQHIAATRRAWGIDRVERRELGTERRLTTADIAANQATISNVRLWDREPLLQTFGQIQSIRTYYEFVSVDDDRYMIGDELRQVMLSARELDVSALPTRTFINEHLTYTHGMGITLGPTNQVTPEGLPVLWIKDLPPASSVPITITRPQIYFGELSNEFILAPTRQRELDFPAGEGDLAVYSTYAGRAGVPVGSFARRLLFAFRFQSLNILLSRDLTANTRILFHRNVRERAERALPFLRFDSDPYVVVTDSGQLRWILDAYTTTSRYPYAQRLQDGTNYMRNSVKVVIDAYDGDVHAYLADPADPMIRTLSRIYPGLLRPLADMPPDLRRHLRYPEDLFRAQTALYATFHMTDAETFYHREDQWQVPVSQRQNDREGFMRHIVMRLPGEAEPEFILMRPFTPRQKDNLAAWIVARNDGENYGELLEYRFPRQSLVFGPTQIVNRINQDPEVARQISLWDQRGSEVIRGELLVIPIESSLIYVQPLYLRAQGGRIPELKRVIVVHQGQAAMEETLEAGLRRLFGGTAGDAPPTAVAATTPDSVGAAARPTAPALATEAEALLQQAMQHYERARAAQRADDWATYGTEMRRLGELLQQLSARRPPQ